MVWCPPWKWQTWVQFQVESHQWLKNWYCSGYPARHLALQGQHWDWLAWCQYSVTGWDRKFDLLLLSRYGSMYNSLSRSIPEIQHVAGILHYQPLTTFFFCALHLCCVLPRLCPHPVTSTMVSRQCPLSTQDGLVEHRRASSPPSIHSQSQSMFLWNRIFTYIHVWNQCWMDALCKT